MISQADLFGEILNPKVGRPNQQKEYDCCEACYNATKERCTCRCGGAFHGLGNIQRREQEERETKAREEAEKLHHLKAPTLTMYDVHTPSRCLFTACEGILAQIEHYPHSEGWVVDGFKEKQWLYKTCRKCGYQWSLEKLGVPRKKVRGVL